MARTNFVVQLRGSGTNTTTGNGASSSSYTALDADFCSESQTGVSRRKPAGWIPPTNYTYNRVKYERASGSAEIKRTSTSTGMPYNKQNFNGCIGYSPGGLFNTLNLFDETYVLGSVSTNMRNAALVKARAKMKNSDINLGVAFAERNRTAKLVGDTAMNMVKAVRQLRHGNVSGAARALGLRNARGSGPKNPSGKWVTGKWLELQYGWKPLLSDVYGASDALARRHNSDWIITAKAMQSERVNIKGKPIGGNREGASYGSASGAIGVFVRIDAVPQNDLLRSFASLGITNPLLIGWELVPFSFVVDWFLPVGSYLDSLDAMLGFGPQWYSSSELRRCRWDVSPRAVVYGTAGLINEYSGNYSGYKEEIRLVRTAGTTVPLPSLPYTKDPRSLGHMANGLSLLAQVFGGR